jgi:hypothetical protein
MRGSKALHLRLSLLLPPAQEKDDPKTECQTGQDPVGLGKVYHFVHAQLKVKKNLKSRYKIPSAL